MDNCENIKCFWLNRPPCLNSKIPYKKGKLFYHESLNKQFVCALIPSKNRNVPHTFRFFCFLADAHQPQNHPPTHLFFCFWADAHQPQNHPPTHLFFCFWADAHQPKYTNIHMVFAFEQMHITPKTIAKNTAKHLQIPILLHRDKPHTTNCGLNANMSN